MLTISGLKKFYFVPDINDMRCGAHRLLEIVKHKHHLCTDNGDVFIFMSKNQRMVKMVNFEENDALQSDGFNVYMYIDKELVDVDHLCCLAHVRAKFKYALEQEKDKEAEYFLRLIGILYDLEEQYRLRHLTPEQILKERQGEQTTRIIKQLRQRLDKLLSDGNPTRGDLMQKALNYLNSFWNQFILYLKDGRYNIDNSLAERSLRTMTVERKNSLSFGSHEGVQISVIYHTFIETCKMCGVSTLEYFKEFFKAIMQGRTDYENMLPMTIGIKK